MEALRPSARGRMHAAAAFLGLILASASYSAAGEANWKRVTYDPTPNSAGGDVYLPMPCGGAMALRRIETTSLTGSSAETNWLNDRKVQLGFAGAESHAVEYLQQRYVQGAFADAATDSRYYLIGKYEVSRAQYASVIDEECPEPDDVDSSYPITDISWFDAVAFTKTYSEWLYQNALDSLPRASSARVGGEPAPVQSYVRLPTEEEWEYAARGGTAVTDQAFRLPVYPFEQGEELASHAWYLGPESSRGELNVIGLLKANPLGLHDVLGNAEEFVLEPFRLNRANRLHGQAGGFVTKGGSFRSPANEIRTSRRDEYGFFDPTSGRARHLDTFGFRVALSAPVQTDPAKIIQIQHAWESVTAGTSLPPGVRDPLVVLQALAERTEEVATVDVIKNAVGRLVEERAQRTELEAQTLRALITSGAMSGRFVKGLATRVARATKAQAVACDYCRSSNKEEFCRRCNVTYPEVVADARSELDTAQNLYLTNLLTISDEFPYPQWGSVVGDLQGQLAASGSRDLIPFTERFVADVRAHQERGALDLDQITRTLQAMPDPK